MKMIEAGGITIYRYVMPGIESNMYLTMQGEQALVVDPYRCEEAIRLMRERQIRDVMILLTHEHFDHISGVNLLRKEFSGETSSVEVIATKAAAAYLPDPNKNMAKFWDITLMDLPKERIEAGMALEEKEYSCTADKVFDDSMDIVWNGHDIHMQSAPGHSVGGALIFLDGILFSGDNLVNGSGVICRMPGGSWKAYCEKTRPVLERLADDTWILPGHGVPDSFARLKKYMQKFGHVRDEEMTEGSK